MKTCERCEYNDELRNKIRSRQEKRAYFDRLLEQAEIFRKEKLRTQ